MNRKNTAIVREVRRTLWNSMNTVFIKLRKIKILDAKNILEIICILSEENVISQHERKTKKAVEAQGAEIAYKKKEQKASISYSIKAIGAHAIVLKNAGYMDEDSYQAFEEWRTKTGEQFMRKQLGL